MRRVSLGNHFTRTRTLLPHDKLDIRQRCRAEPASSRKRMILSRDGNDLVVTERHDVGRIGRRTDLRSNKLAVLPEHGALDLFGVGDHEFDGHARIQIAIGVHQCGHQIRADRVARCNRQMPALETGELADGSLRSVGAVCSTMRSPSPVSTNDR